LLVYCFHVRVVGYKCVTLTEIVCCELYSVPRRCTLTNAKAVIMLLTLILICVNVHYFWSFDLVRVSETLAPGEPATMACTFTQNELRQSVFFQEKVWPALNKAVSELLPIGSIVVCTVIMIICLARGRQRGTAAYRRWRERYTLEPCGVEQLVWMFVNVCLVTICLTLPLTIVTSVREIASSTDTGELTEFDLRLFFFEAVCTQAQYCCLSLKMFVYVASSSRFRHELRSIFYVGVK